MCFIVLHCNHYWDRLQGFIEGTLFNRAGVLIRGDLPDLAILGDIWPGIREKKYWCRVLNSEQSVTIHNTRFDIIHHSL